MADDDALVQQTQELFRRRLGRSVSEEEARTIIERTLAFFRLLQEWRRELAAITDLR